MLQASSDDIQTTVDGIIKRFKREGSNNPRIAHWLLNILQMCTVHCTETFLEELNDEDMLRPLCRALCKEKYMKHYDEVVRLKLFTLLKSWHEKYQEFLPDSAFTETYERVFRDRDQTRLQPLNLHWFPNRNIINQTLDSFTYDLGNVGKELLDRGNKTFEDLKLLCADPKHHNLEHAEADAQDLLNTAHMTLTQVEANVRFWEDIVQHADIDDISLRAIGASGYKLRKLKYDVEQIIENIKVSENQYQYLFIEGKFGSFEVARAPTSKVILYPWKDKTAASTACPHGQ
ncbi:unnamed protein product [Dibothriocephalus latus]|uniref:VHS domain-containing protein n=1 Tax=Dibothriocephalus latus TaxID=60516 RepID=A0A3P7NN15_DIBLA|nr:unnamed protein product [Dibothriocephalus latus]